MNLLLPSAFATVQALPGILKLVQHLVLKGIPIAIATGSTRVNYLLKTAHLAELFSYFRLDSLEGEGGGRTVICGDDALLKGVGKPDPTIFILAAELLNFSTEEQRSHILVFEDSILGVEAARRAGMEVIWCPDPDLLSVLSEQKRGGLGGDGSAREEGGEWKASEMVKSLVEFRPEKWGLPAYD